MVLRLEFSKKNIFFKTCNENHFSSNNNNNNNNNKIFITPHAQRERGKVIGCGVHIYIYIYICLWTFVDSPFQTFAVGLLVEFID